MQVGLKEILIELKNYSNPDIVKGMARFGISSKNTIGVSMPVLRNLAKKIGKHHLIAQQLWNSNIHEARILASLVDEPEKVTQGQMEEWVKGFESWDVCDQVCGNLFRKTEYVDEKIAEWVEREEEFVKRAGFVLMAQLAVHDKKSKNEKFVNFLSAIEKESCDDRNFVKKAVNWALRQIGKRNSELKLIAIGTAEVIARQDSKSARWIAADALRELNPKFAIGF